MNRKFLGLIAITLLAAIGLSLLSHASPRAQQPATSQILLPPEQKHLKNARQLTFGGQNAEAYFSADNKQLIFQHQGEGVSCDQIYTMPVDTPDGKPATPKLVSTGKGRTTCSYFFPGGDKNSFFFHPCLQRRLPAQA